uniref:ANK_REP_REGION domain-containing protein n=1 Tax=Macrostomum lignano TaxID=282301 RepID=A0A1I8H8K3_9PLAT
MSSTNSTTESAGGVSPEAHCSARCRSRRHCLEINACLSQLLLNMESDDDNEESAMKLCAPNIGQAVDHLGRTPLHVAAASGAGSRLLDRLIRLHRMSVEARDWENGWTPLHRCVYHGQLETAVRLISSFGASLSATDHNGLTPLDLADLLDIPQSAAFPGSPAETCPGYDAYTWGDSANHTLGRARIRYCGRPGACLRIRPAPAGPGRRCRRALGRAHSAAPASVVGACRSAAGSGPSVAVGREHTLMLTRSGRLIVAGQDPGAASAQLLPNASAAAATAESHLPRPVAGWRPETGRRVLGIAAARYHSAVVTESQVFVWGQDRGQFGQPLLPSNQQQPRVVARPTPLACLAHMHQRQQLEQGSATVWDPAAGGKSGSGGISILALASCDSALLVHIERRHSQHRQQTARSLPAAAALWAEPPSRFLLQVTNIAPKWSGLRSVMLAEDPSHFGRCLTACLLTLAGELFLWQPGWQQPFRLRPRPSPLGTVTSACLTHRALLIGTGRGRGYRVDLSSPTRLSLRARHCRQPLPSPPCPCPPRRIRSRDCTGRPDCLPIHAAEPSPLCRHFLTDLPEPPAPLVYADMADCLAELLDRAHETGADAELVGSDGVRIGAHRFLLADRSAALADWLINC